MLNAYASIIILITIAIKQMYTQLTYFEFS